MPWGRNWRDSATGDTDSMTIRTFAHLGVLACALLMVVTRASAQVPAGTASLAGVIRDSAGAPIAGAEVILRENDVTLRSVRADGRGAYTLAGVKPGRYSVWFRRLGYHSADYNWAAKFDERTDLPVTLHHIARTLNAVVVRETEDKLMKGNSSLLGLVLDEEGKPVAEAGVDLVGADRGAGTRENGGFLFKPVPLGTYVLRVRELHSGQRQGRRSAAAQRFFRQRYRAARDLSQIHGGHGNTSRSHAAHLPGAVVLQASDVLLDLDKGFQVKGVRLVRRRSRSLVHAHTFHLMLSNPPSVGIPPLRR